MTVVLTIFHVIFCFTLILVILLQAGRGQGLTGPSFASGNVQSLFGTRAADVLTKATSVAAICFLLTSISLDYIEVQKSKSLLEGPRKVAPIDIEKIKQALEKVKGEGQIPEAGPSPAGADSALPAEAGAPVQEAVSLQESAGAGLQDALNQGLLEQEAGNALLLPEESAGPEKSVDAETAKESQKT